MKTLHELTAEGITAPSEGTLADVILIEIELEPEYPYLDVDKVIGQTHEFTVQAYTYKTDGTQLLPQDESVTIAETFTWQMSTCLDKLICFKVYRQSMHSDISTALEGLPQQFTLACFHIAREAFNALDLFACSTHDMESLENKTSE